MVRRLVCCHCVRVCVCKMGALLLLGCVMIGFALPAALFALLLMRRSQLVIVMLARSATQGAREQ